MKTVLLVDDDQEFTTIAARIIEFIGCDVYTAGSIEEAKQWLADMRFDHLFLDFMLPDGSGLHLIDHIRNQKLSAHITLITGHPSVKAALANMCDDQINYLTKPIEADDVKRVLNRKTTAKPSQADPFERHFGCLIGHSPAMKKLVTMIERVAKTNANVMLMGESGVGKEVVAQAIHNASQCSGEQVAINCGAIAKDLIGSELFGHEKGAFTGAISQKQGVFELAQDGTLFLDEVTEMPIEVQPNLLRALETKTVTRVGGAKPIDVNCRVVSATNRTLAEIAHKNVLREDIYFRLAVFPIEIPPLRARPEDIPLLSEFFVHQLNEEYKTHYQLSEQAHSVLAAHSWPGNIRELKHCIHRAFIMADPDTTTLTIDEIVSSPFTTPQESQGQVQPAESAAKTASVAAPSAPVKVGETIEEVEKKLIYQTLNSVDGNKTLAAKMLGISTKTLYNRLNAYEQSTSEDTQ
ncbi:sigma-54-dependent Fis family transcriptional regulator [Pseudoalteromonas rubra]|uniref:Sigma-54-dependent Fis family transcriptional regulator n=1 Tax=Pseudoalteromonas rubra TaxID=43658 RepID=A0A4Q7EN64_9GAMM|nr:sigma-54 dependent transcriptional regulator [Pseudoalteromonas rubra]RZM85442.1 sigma-54-dependent Fis family transcriptional regulator [Pseudoalteromonas rubra]